MIQSFFFKWTRNEKDEEDDPYEAPILTHNKEMDQLVEANTISSKVEEEFASCTNGGMTKLDDEKENNMLR